MTTIQWVSAAIFAIAVAHTFSTKLFEKLAHRQPNHAGVWHLLGEVEIVFGFWAMVLIVALAIVATPGDAIGYLDARNFTEPMFVFAIMVIAGTRAILQLSRAGVIAVARFVPLPGAVGFHFVALSVVPLLGSLITEPAAMTLAALMLRDRIFGAAVSQKLKYATIGTLFVNVSIGGTLTAFAAPPVLMVAAKWNWDSWYMLSHFGWKAAIAVIVNALAVALIFRSELSRLPRTVVEKTESVPVWVGAIHVALLAGVVALAHHPAAFMGLLVAFFLAGLVVLGGQQQWWLEPLLHSMDDTTVYFGATALTAITDNAALTYLGSQVEGLSESFKQALVAGAVTGGGLTVIANAPNPAGFAILRSRFEDGAISPLGLFVAAFGPTLVAILAFRAL
jgi:hypothetical protein